MDNRINEAVRPDVTAATVTAQATEKPGLNTINKAQVIWHQAANDLEVAKQQLISSSDEPLVTYWLKLAERVVNGETVQNEAVVKVLEQGTVVEVSRPLKPNDQQRFQLTNMRVENGQGGFWLTANGQNAETGSDSHYYTVKAKLDGTIEVTSLLPTQTNATTVKIQPS